jgi:hypothetical protein
VSDPLRWLEDMLSRAREMRRDGARRGVGSYSGGKNDGWVEALEQVQSQLNIERNQTMPKTLDFFKMLKVIGEVMTDLPSLEAMAKGLAQGKMPTPAEIALLVKLIEDVKAAVGG